VSCQICNGFYPYLLLRKKEKFSIKNLLVWYVLFSFKKYFYISFYICTYDSHECNSILFSSLDKREKILKTCALNSTTISTAPSPKATKKKIPKGNKGKDSGTSSEEERWLDAIESGKLEEVFFFFKSNLVATIKHLFFPHIFALDYV